MRGRAGGRPSVPNDLSDAQVHLGMRGSRTVSTPITITVSSAHAEYTCGLLAGALIAAGEALTEWS